MAGERLLDGDDVEHARATCFVHPHAFHPGETRALHFIPDHAGLHHALGVRKVGWWHHRAGEAEDRLVAVIDALDPHYGLFPAAAGVVAGEFAHRAFGHRLARMHRAFEHDLRMCRHRQTVDLTLNDVVRRPAMTGGIVVL